MKRFITLGVIAILALGLIVGCEEDEDLESQSLLSTTPEGGYLPFPQDSSEIPDPDTLEYYPYDPNLYIPYDFSSLNLTEYPEPDSSQIDSADWAIWIPKAESSITIEEFLAIPRAILPETTMVQLAVEYPGYFEGEELGHSPNDCPFDDNKRGDVLLVRTPPCFWGRHNHAGMWRGTSGYSGVEIVHSIASGVCWASAGSYHRNWKRCRVLRVTTWPYSTSYRSAAATYSEDQYGKPYNKNWLWKYDKTKFYCSQLCWAGYWRSGRRIDIDIYCIHYIPYFGFVPDFHVAPDEIWINWRTHQIAKSSGRW